MSSAVRALVLLLASMVGTSPAVSLLCEQSCHESAKPAAQRRAAEVARAAEANCHDHAGRTAASSRIAAGHHRCDHEPLAPTASASVNLSNSYRDSHSRDRAASFPALHTIVFTASTPPVVIIDARQHPPGLTSPPRSARPSVLRI